MAVIRRATPFLQRWKKKINGLLYPQAPEPPFDFSVQIGDPILRQKAARVKPEDIKSDEIQKVLITMHDVLKRNQLCGLAAPQVGVPLQIFVTAFSIKQMERFSTEEIQEQRIRPWPFKVFINPELVVEDSASIVDVEGCLSVQGFQAEVPRATKVTVHGLDDSGSPHSWTASHFAARVAQHEMDHLNGKLYVDHMDPRTFQFVLWKYVQTLPRARRLMGGT